MQLFENTVKLRGFLDGDPEVPTLDRTVEGSDILLVLRIESGTTDKKTGAWSVRSVKVGVICPGPNFAGVTPEMQAGDYIEVDAELDTIDVVRDVKVADEHYPVIRHFLIVRGLRVNKLHLPSTNEEG